MLQILRKKQIEYYYYISWQYIVKNVGNIKLLKTMTNPTPYNQLRQLLTERLPHLKELSFGCEIKLRDFDQNHIFLTEYIGDQRFYTEHIYDETIYSFENGVYIPEIIGHPPTLQDVLLVIDIKRSGIETAYRTKSAGLDLPFCEETYDLTKPLADQSDETLLALIELIK